MDSQDSSAAIYSEAKSEYTKQLVFNFQPVLLRFFLDRFTEYKGKAKPLSEFQESLSQIPEWNLDKVNSETTTLLKAIQCDYIEDLITAVFIAHTKILSAIRLHSKPRRKINITVPKPEHFMHRAMSESSRILWSNVYLFNDTVPSIERQKYMNEVNRFLEEGILQAIRNLLPVKSILRDSLQEDDDDAIQLNATEDVTKASDTPVVNEIPVLNEIPVVNEIPDLFKVPEETKDDEGSKVAESVNLDESVKLSSDVHVTENKVQELPVIPKSAKVVEVTRSPETLVIDTEKSVGFTGIDSVFGTSGEAELQPMTEEGDDDLKIIGELEDLKMEDIEDLDNPTTTPLAVNDYEIL
jgi:hypothetical protein